MSNEAELRPKQLGSMTTGEIMTRIQTLQQQIDMCLDQLTLRASLQGYTEQLHDELLTLLQEALTYLKEAPVPSGWIDRRNELVRKLREKL
jgi:hypothetical protein